MTTLVAQRTIALAGRPNTGKTTLFNALTGHNQRIANFAGSTVEKAIGTLTTHGQTIDIIDLPGTTTLAPKTADEQVAIDFIAAEQQDHFAICAVAEASNLEHDLALALMLHRLGYAVTLVLNMMDEAEKNGLRIDVAALEREIGFPVLPTSAHSGQGITALKTHITTMPRRALAAPASAITALSTDDLVFMQTLATDDARRISAAVTRGSSPTEPLPKIKEAMGLDRFFLHPLFGPLFFLAVMVLLFQSIFTWAAPLTDLINAGVRALSNAIDAVVTPASLASFLTDGVLAGMGAVLVFVPQIAILFLLIGFLEKTGYLPRAAALMDRLMRPFGLDGKAFIPLLSSFACAIPGIMATRTLDSQRRRLSTILIAPLMTCSARLPVYTLIISAFVPGSLTTLGMNGQGMVMVIMYLAAIVFAMLVALGLKLTGLGGEDSSHYILFPPFRMPRVAELVHYSAIRAWMFVKKAGKVIFIVSILLWVLGSFPSAQIEESYLGQLGKAVQPLFAPLGYDWRLSVAILTAFAAREVFVGTLGTIFALGTVDEYSPSLVDALQRAQHADGTPLYTIATAVSLLLLFAIALQCMSTIAVTRRETGSWKWPVIQFTYLWIFAYAAAFAGYRFTLWVM